MSAEHIEAHRQYADRVSSSRQIGKVSHFLVAAQSVRQLHLPPTAAPLDRTLTIFEPSARDQPPLPIALAAGRTISAKRRALTEKEIFGVSGVRVYTTASLTSMLFRVALEYGQTWCACSTSFSASALSTPGRWTSSWTAS